MTRCAVVDTENPRFDGETYEPEKDQARLGTQLAAVRDLMLDGRWRPLHIIVRDLAERGVHASEASVSARLRDLRKPRFGAYVVERSRKNAGLFLYRVLERE